MTYPQNMENKYYKRQSKEEAMTYWLFVHVAN